MDQIEPGQSPVDVVLARQADLMERHGWYYHYVPISSGAINAHTHGLKETHGHSDLQIVFPLSMDTVHDILWGCVHRIEAGESFQDGDRVSRIIRDFPVLFISARDNTREVLRIIFPNAKGELDRQALEPPFDLQYVI